MDCTSSIVVSTSDRRKMKSIQTDNRKRVELVVPQIRISTGPRIQQRAHI